MIITITQTNFKAKSKWLIPICMHSHWSAAVRDYYSGSYNYHLDRCNYSQVVEVLENKIVMLDSLHTQLISAADKLK